MPKELTHLIVSAEALEKVKMKSSEAAAILKENLDLFMLGSLICDTAYYHIPVFNRKKSVLSISQTIHNAGGDLNKEFIARLAKNQGQCRPDQHFAFLCGVLSHHITDRAFHPLVVYLTGDYHARDARERHFAEARHRFLEGLIDRHLAKGSDLDLELKKDGEADIKRDKTVLHPLLLSFVYSALPQLDHKRAEEMALTLFKLSGFQLALLKLYNKSYFRSFILTTNRLFCFKLSNYAAMLYPAAGSSKMPLLAGEINYLDPFSGVKHKESLLEIKERAVSSLTGAIVDCHDAKGDLGATLAPSFQPPSRKTGRPEFSNTSEIDRALKVFLGMRA